MKIGPDTRQALLGQPGPFEGAPLHSPTEAHPPSASLTLRAQEERPNHHPCIDVRWLNRGLSKYYIKATTRRRKAKEALDIIQDTAYARECEYLLVRLLAHDCLDFISMLMKNRPGGTSSEAPATPEDAGSLEDSRDSV